MKQSSQQRVAASEKFQESQKDIDKYVARKERKTISLNEETLRKERDDQKKEKDEEKKDGEEDEDDLAGGSRNGPIFRENHYNNEVLHISLDYIQLFKGARTVQK